MVFATLRGRLSAKGRGSSWPFETWAPRLATQDHAANPTKLARSVKGQLRLDLGIWRYKREAARPWEVKRRLFFRCAYGTSPPSGLPPPLPT